MYKKTAMTCVALGFIVLGLQGCATAPQGMTAEQLARASEVEFVRPYELSRTDVEFISVGPVQGQSCASHLLADNASQEQALMEMKLAAAERQANRVVLKQCRQDDNAGCSKRWLCEGDAYQAQPLQ
ncbi:Outer membrane lipoprotein RcsF [Pseudidiomarina piscicola]|uniref:Outer membrane lipoprotein RcsF n=1 Tax=Pseudidiomarina piscicola TaxID=2614830 RepID=A0A6S6WR11_9GAMM|nr:Rcs stress response system protein RcsF [Pseudidiomarina piscicola]CAB0151597.1 Outer membrane lipoprotein RcsF [Pseudidiomarina piscicola]VZT41062.1 Outer membrane lipoprotein RcsF [Pseudomonas aeruginosa]